ncbi:hypothetical protein, partial [Litorimonas sp.]|uniref:hypothetical protein n=1 Tax=Litorimonas sp. TaxID=1892381 RepID=UPI003A8ABB8A
MPLCGTLQFVQIDSLDRFLLTLTLEALTSVFRDYPKERDRDLRLRTTSDTGGSLQGRCDINRRRGVCPLRNI